MLTCVDGVSLRQNSRQDSLGAGNPHSGRDWERITGTPCCPKSGFLRCLRRDRLRFSTGKKGWFPGFGRWTQPICQSRGSGHCPPHSRNPKVF